MLDQSLTMNDLYKLLQLLKAQKLAELFCLDFLLSLCIKKCAPQVASQNLNLNLNYAHEKEKLDLTRI